MQNHVLDYLTEIVKEVSPTLSIHDFRVVKGPTHTNLIFDMVIPFDIKRSEEELKKEIQQYVKEHTAPYKYPRIVVFRDELPKTISGKIQRNKL